MSQSKENPSQVNLTAAEAEALKKRIKENKLLSSDLEIFMGLVNFSLWVSEKLSKASLTIARLKKLFGYSSEKKKKKRPPSDPETTDSEAPATSSDEEHTPRVEDAHSRKTEENNLGYNSSVEGEPVWDLDENHGRLCANDYPGCPILHVPFDTTENGASYCPHCAEHNTIAKLYPAENDRHPKVVVLLEGTPLISGVRYVLERKRCGVCGQRFEAELPDHLKNRGKYDISCFTTLAIYHYYAGFPFKRIETTQHAQGVPLPDATQFDLMNQLYKEVIQAVFSALESCSAQGSLFHYDDTEHRILEVLAENNQRSPKAPKTSIHSTAVVSYYGSHKIYLFYTNAETAGESFKHLLTKRETSEDFLTMTDASSSNFPSDVEETLLARWILCLCLVHGRRHFFRLIGEADGDIDFVLKIITAVYKNERYCKEHQYNDEERLRYHQQKSRPLMESMRLWFNNLIKMRRVEPTSQFGQAIAYMLKKWHWLTQFYRVPGAKLDNNLCEQAIRFVIKYRKNSLFYKNFYGAQIGDAMLSVMHTATMNGVNIFDYLNTLQTYSQQVRAAPEQWLPWCYQKTVSALNGTSAPDISMEKEAINSS